MASEKILGIDLGTAYSCVAYMNENGMPEVLPNSDDKRTTPSVVWFNEERVVVGDEAKAMATVSPTEVVSFIKREMGDDSYYFECKQGRLRPPEISSYILKKLVKNACDRLGEEITNVVITCPAYFFVKERNATRDAGIQAGLNVIDIVNEPTAAAVSYGFTTENAGAGTNVLVYDLGGGTFDVTVITITPEKMDVVCTGGDHKLGGKDWDDQLIGLMMEKAVEQRPDLAKEAFQEPEVIQDLRRLAEDTKRSLTLRNSSPVRLTIDGDSINIVVTREDFELVTESLLDQTISFTRNEIQTAAEKGVIRIDHLILVGGSTRMPQVVRRLKAEFPQFDPQVFDPDEAVAKGAAIIGKNRLLKDKIRAKTRELLRDDDFELEALADDGGFTLSPVDEKILQKAIAHVATEEGFSLGTVTAALKIINNVSSKSFGLVYDDMGPSRDESRVINLIYRNTKVPCQMTRPGYTIVANQSHVRVQIMENSEDPEEQNSAFEDPKGIDLDLCTLLWEGLLPLPPDCPASTEVLSTFKLDENGLLSVECFEPASGNRLNHEIQTAPTLSAEEKKEIRDRQASLVVE